MSELSDTQRLVEIEAIKRLKALKCRSIDTADWATFEALHAPDFVSFVNSTEPYPGIKASTERMAKQYREMGMVTVHHVNAPEIELVSATEATGVWSMESYMYWKQGEEEHRMHGLGFYHETYEKRAGRWLFTSRRVQQLKVEATPGAVLG